MDTLIELIGFAAFGHVTADFFSELGFTKKPWACNMCMATWSAMIPMVYWYGPWGIFLATAAGVLSEMIYQQLSK